MSSSVVARATEDLFAEASLCCNADVEALIAFGFGWWDLVNWVSLRMSSVVTSSSNLPISGFEIEFNPNSRDWIHEIEFKRVFRV